MYCLRRWFSHRLLGMAGSLVVGFPSQLLDHVRLRTGRPNEVGDAAARAGRAGTLPYRRRWRCRCPGRSRAPGGPASSAACTPWVLALQDRSSRIPRCRVPVGPRRSGSGSSPGRSLSSPTRPTGCRPDKLDSRLPHRLRPPNTASSRLSHGPANDQPGGASAAARQVGLEIPCRGF
jgi:hypothetical protein